jgi:hypothetical protein
MAGILVTDALADVADSSKTRREVVAGFTRGA